MIRNRVTTKHIILKDDTPGNALWGRRSEVSAFSGILSMGAVIASPLFVLFIFISLQHFNGSVLDAGIALISSWSDFFLRYLPRLTTHSATIYTGWVIGQAVLYSTLPGKIVSGAQTPGGNALPYKMNGLASWFVTVGVFLLIAWKGGVQAAAALADSWGGVLVAANIYGIAVSVLAWLKGRFMPSYMQDRRLSGSIFHDFLSGIELNPRIGRYWDFKLFQIGRLGMNSWVVIDLSFAAQQYHHYGTVSNSMLIVIILHTIYVVDFFINEAWYLNTIDIAHDHFGFYLGWGSAVWLPYIYTSQAQYLSSRPEHLSTTTFWLILTTGVLGYILFRLANHQKHLLRTKGINCKIAGQRPKVIKSRYTTATGEINESLLLRSGCWGIVRHPNYIGDLILSFCACVCCGWDHFLPYTYFAWMTGLLIHRCLRDEKRCLAKHGKAWEEYQRLVKWRLIPGVF
ncbi:hypothetical protein ASPWEDRAFT_110782 [Aspergillus wentii DTO 134E9]|uniref:7-dehydrocholesterol reductase n=1 Tax=Aspergillus wentii DTO 134E9 TaxID=1073089 RepID=A0A1L9RMF9_ASPWE|nr:uncharacterized protein ASPWEDRAFT_110782 [Aspergillus wentii DTO 134E9]KAI9929474.1 hypothetical protein MW887_000947 [Aspergillus wentii]OJJ36084.1 hypothetical protein ASPWEDRAFT_110782 [Aspergillus wentii DTO 134E9]